MLARAFDRDLELPGLIDRIVLMGGAWQEPGNAGPVSEFHFALRPAGRSSGCCTAARRWCWCRWT